MSDSSNHMLIYAQPQLGAQLLLSTLFLLSTYFLDAWSQKLGATSMYSTYNELMYCSTVCKERTINLSIPKMHYNNMNMTM